MREPLHSRWRALLSWPKRMVLLYRSLCLSFCEFEIPGTTEAPPLRGVYIGEGLALAYYLKLYRATVTESGKIPAWRMRGMVRAARASAPIVLVEINRTLDFLLPADGLRADS